MDDVAKSADISNELARCKNDAISDSGMSVSDAQVRECRAGKQVINCQALCRNSDI